MEKLPLPVQIIERKIYLIRGEKIMLDRDLAELYGVSTKAFNQAVKRNIERFPEDFMFRLTPIEAKIFLGSRSQFVTLNLPQNLKSQIATSRRGQNIKYAPYAFTEQGVAMLSSVLKSQRAVQVNIAIMRAFVRLRELFSTNKNLAVKLEELERKYEKHDVQIKGVFDALRKLLRAPKTPRKSPIGFRA